MINELYELSEAMEKSGIEENAPARNYPSLAGGDCLCVNVKDGFVTDFYQVDDSKKALIHKYGVTSKGFYPCVNLAPLFRVVDKDAIASINYSKKTPELLSNSLYEQIVSWCREDNFNWDKKVTERCKRSLVDVSKELRATLQKHPYEPLIVLCKETDYFDGPQRLHSELKRAALQAIERKENVSLALALLFACATKHKENGEYGSLGTISILFDTERLLEAGMPSVTTENFSKGLNKALLATEQQSNACECSGLSDAFQLPYSVTDAVMPEIKLAAGFSIKLRAMNKDVPCQHRYKQEGIDTYPASAEIRQRLSRAMTYISKEENRDSTWMTISYIDKKPIEVLFAYPLELTRTPQNFVQMFHRRQNGNISFTSQAKQFLSEIKTPRLQDADTHADGIRIFVLRRINVDNNSGRAKVIFTRQTDPYELEKQSEVWTVGCMNLPAFSFGQPSVPFPLDAADILNRFWNQKGESITDKFKPVPKYHGMELLMDGNYSVTADLHCLAEKAMTIGAFLGKKLTEGDLNHPIWDKIKDMLALSGLLLYRDGIGKDAYMESLPYLYGQLLKVSDELHALYCNSVRDGELPTQLAGGSLYQAAVEAPIRTLDMLGQRINPYILWAKTYRTKNVSEKGKESWRAGWLISLYENIATELHNAWNAQSRFNDEEKALLFLGYLAKPPKIKHPTDGTEEVNNMEEANDHE